MQKNSHPLGCNRVNTHTHTHTDTHTLTHIQTHTINAGMGRRLSISTLNVHHSPTISPTTQDHGNLQQQHHHSASIASILTICPKNIGRYDVHAGLLTPWLSREKGTVALAQHTNITRVTVSEAQLAWKHCIQCCTIFCKHQHPEHPEHPLPLLFSKMPPVCPYSQQLRCVNGSGRGGVEMAAWAPLRDPPTHPHLKITSQRLLDQSQAGVYMGKTPHTPPFWPFWGYSRTLPQGVELLV